MFSDDPNSISQVPLVITIIQLFSLCVVANLFDIIPSGWTFGGRAASKARRCLVSQMFMACYLSLDYNACIAYMPPISILFVCLFVCLCLSLCTHLYKTEEVAVLQFASVLLTLHFLDTTLAN